MEYAVFGKTGFTASRIGFGGAPAGLANYLDSYDPQSAADRKEVQQALETALQLGINYFDTAAGYGAGESESIFGEVLRGVSDIFVATKCALGTVEQRERSLEASLGRLRRDRVDLLQLHGTSYSMADCAGILQAGGAAHWLEQVKQKGLVRFIGFTSEDSNEGVWSLVDSGRFDAVQLCYNLLYQHPYEPTRPFGCMLAAEKQGMGIAVMRSATSGIFQRWVQQVNPQNTFDYTDALIQYVLSNPYVDVALIGMRSAEIVHRNVRVCEDVSGRIDLTNLHERYV